MERTSCAYPGRRVRAPGVRDHRPCGVDADSLRVPDVDRGRIAHGDGGPRTLGRARRVERVRRRQRRAPGDPRRLGRRGIDGHHAGDHRRPERLVRGRGHCEPRGEHHGHRGAPELGHQDRRRPERQDARHPGRHHDGAGHPQLRPAALQDDGCRREAGQHEHGRHARGAGRRPRGRHRECRAIHRDRRDWASSACGSSP